MTDLYRFFDADNRLLYVGISLHAAQRASEHRRDKPWWPDVARMEIERHTSREAAIRAESQAITKERPLHNVVGAPRTPLAPRAGNKGCIPWKCGRCQTQIRVGSQQGYIQVNANDAWECVCRTCDHRSSSRYWIDAARITTGPDIQHWTEHLLQKRWFRFPDWLGMLEASSLVETCVSDALDAEDRYLQRHARVRL